MSKRVRIGQKGLYYTNGRLDNCDYNKYNCSVGQAYYLAMKQFRFKDVLDVWVAFLQSIIAILFLFVYLPFSGFIFKVYHHFHLKKEHDEKSLIQLFPKDYYEVLWEDEDSVEEE